MKIKAESTKPSNKKTPILCAFVLENSNEPIGLGKIHEKINSSVKESIKEIKGKVGEISIIQTLGITPANKILIAGLGPKNKLSTDVLRNVTGKIAEKVRSLGLSEFSIVIPIRFPIDSDSSISAVVEGTMLFLYSFDKFKKEKSEKSPDLSILVSNSQNAQKVISQTQIVAEGTLFARDTANLPPNECSPSTLASITKSLSSKNKLKCKIFSKNELKHIILEHSKGRRNDKPVVIVGKAVTFDTGGISLKPGDKMDEMKFDKCGGCTVLGIMKAVSELKLPVNVVGIIPSVENMPGGESYRPGDIVKLYGGSTAEILNTDAEGRLILSDALSYGVKTYKPKAVLDFATLTGACIVALGPNVAGLVSNNNGIASKIRKSSDRTGEQVWQLPLNEDYTDMKKSDYADIKNVGIGRSAGAITAAAFLANAVGTTPWAHFDIAGTAWIQTGTKEKSYNPKGATGFGVRLGVDYLAN